ncbi:8f43c205-7ff4-4704-a337-e14aeeba9b57 [Thermothielavioides terrestris]|uniref:H/ACA ribonucleoprotein complex non-core subunit NAF1 n=1 Tax=Thermothielavioides terrestris TaxID=2587410 RepID=A0A3S4ATC1_9PEZI|nr:8f43c205-7ff4-4704-a337-e14aeeba9b57 [Thermothielavioides terrestris]
MAQTTFQIPGLGQAKPNEELPVENFAPDLLAAAASISGENGLVVGGTNGNAQWEKAQKMKKERQDEDARSTTATAEQAGDGVELDAKPASAVAEHADEKKDVQMQDQELRNGGDEGRAADVDMTASNDAPSPDVTHALEAALDGMLSHAVQPAQRVQGQEQQNDAGSEEQEDGQPEWEADSSPYESSSESSSSDSSSDDDSEDEGGYPLLGIEETARLLMAADGEGEGDGDGDGAGRSKGASAALRTKNEIVDEVIPIPDVTITPEMKIERLGNIEFIVENTVVIKSQTPGEVQVLDLGSVLCKEDRTVIGALAEVLGNVRSPMYTVGFRAEDEIKQLGLVVGLPIYYSVEHANYVFTQPLREAKGTDASNLHDEEAAADEMEFSDDEKEAEFKRQQKMKKRGGKAGRGGREQSIATSHTLSPHPPPAGLNYDEDDDGPYKPFRRPVSVRRVVDTVTVTAALIVEAGVISGDATSVAAIVAAIGDTVPEEVAGVTRNLAMMAHLHRRCRSLIPRHLLPRIPICPLPLSQQRLERPRDNGRPQLLLPSYPLQWHTRTRRQLGRLSPSPSSAPVGEFHV